MSKAAEKFFRSVGTTVNRVIVEILLWDGEPDGSVGNILVEFEDGRKFLLGCKGDGSIYITRHQRGDAGVPPGFSKILRPIEDLQGNLSEIEARHTSLVLFIGDKRLELINDDDELIVTVDGTPLGRGFLRKGNDTPP